jgi:hypothetical protein
MKVVDCRHRYRIRSPSRSPSFVEESWIESTDQCVVRPSGEVVRECIASVCEPSLLLIKSDARASVVEAKGGPPQLISPAGVGQKPVSSENQIALNLAPLFLLPSPFHRVKATCPADRKHNSRVLDRVIISDSMVGDCAITSPQKRVDPVERKGWSSLAEGCWFWVS